MDKREIKIIKKDGTIKTVVVDWDKMPCSKCEWRYSMHCPMCNWNKGQVLNY